MKKITIALLLATFCICLNLSCHKHPIPHKKTCQIKSIQYNYQDKQTQLTYSYNNKRLLSSIAGQSSVDPPVPANISITYNNQGRPIGGVNFSSTPYKMIYENGSVARIENLGADNLYHTVYTYTYDSLGRVIKRVEPNGITFQWEYTDASPNFTRMFELYPLRPGRLDLFAVHTYEYDDKINPWSTWQNTTLNPYYFDIVRGGRWEHMPIPRNNITHYTLYFTLRGMPLKSDEFFYTYQYDEEYPVTQDVLRLVFNPFLPGSVDSTRGVNYYSYDCIGGGSHNGK